MNDASGYGGGAGAGGFGGGFSMHGMGGGAGRAGMGQAGGGGGGQMVSTAQHSIAATCKKRAQAWTYSVPPCLSGWWKGC